MVNLPLADIEEMQTSRRIARMVAEDRLEGIADRLGRLQEVSKLKHGIQTLPIEWSVELGSDLEWCTAEIRRLRIEVERLQHELRPASIDR